MRFLGLGGTDEVGGSSYLYELDGLRLLVDAGVRPTMMGEASLPSFGLLEDHPPDLMILTHAHLDHVGALPLVKRRFPQLPIYATRATQRLALEVLTDSVKVGESQGVQLFSLGEATATIADLRTLEAFTPLPIPGGQVTAYPAGHILGAVGLLIETKTGRLFHTGDFSNIATLTTEAAYAPPEPVPVDAVVSESTYGDTNLPGRKEQIRTFIDALRATLEGGGRVLIPTFALGRAQELILLLLNHQMSGLLPRVPIYLDGLVRTLTTSFEELLPELPERLRNFSQSSGMSPFYREGVQVVQHAKERARILEMHEPSIILASSGMLSGGPSPQYARAILQEEASALFVVGYQDAESPGRRLLELQRGGEVHLPVGRGGEYEAVPALCSVARYYLSAHADRMGIINHLSRYPSPRLVLMHGESNARHTLMEAFKKDRHVNLARNGEWVDLLGETRFTKSNTAPSPVPVSTPEQTPPVARKMKRFKKNVQLTVEGQEVRLTFGDDVNLKHLFPEGTYSLTVLKGVITRAELRQRQGAMQNAEEAEALVDSPTDETDEPISASTQAEAESLQP